MSACIIKVKFLSALRISSTEILKVVIQKYAQLNRRTSVVSRTQQPLLLASEGDKFDVRAKPNTEAFDCTRDGQKAYRSGPVVVSTWRPHTAK